MNKFVFGLIPIVCAVVLIFNTCDIPPSYFDDFYNGLYEPAFQSENTLKNMPIGMQNAIVIKSVSMVLGCYALIISAIFIFTGIIPVPKLPKLF